MLTTNETFPVKSNEALMIYFILYVCYCLLIGAILWKGFLEDGSWYKGKHLI